MRFTSGLILAVAVWWCGCARPERAASPGANAAPRPGPGVFFVATNGNDAWSGRLPSPNWRKTDGPFATPAHAVEAMRQGRAQRSVRELLRVFLRQGTYFLDEPLVLKPEDSGLVLAAHPGEAPVLSGGRRITGWKEVEREGKRLWATKIPQARAGQWVFRELWVNGTRAVRARHPNKGYLGIAAVPDKAPEWMQGQRRFRFHEGDLKPWPSITNAEVVVMNRWVESRLPVISVDEKERIVAFGKRAVFALAPGDLYYAEGALEFLDEPGEWCLEPATGALYYMPRPGEKLGQVEAVAPALVQVLRLEGKPESGQFIERVVVRGLTFTHTEWNLPEPSWKGTDEGKDEFAVRGAVGGFDQADVGVPGAVWGEGMRQCAFEQCRFCSLGNYGLELARGCDGNRISRCEFSDLGAGGIKIGESRVREGSAEQTGDNEISHCRIHDGGKMFHSAVGIWIGQSPDNRLLHNLIHDFYYTGISIGWTWGYGPSLATNNTVEFNHVHHIGVKSDGDGPILSDMGGIYTLGRQPGTTICNNLWHDIAGVRYGGWGIYFDEGSSGILAESNVVYHTTHGGFHQHYGETNVVRNNIFAFGRDCQLQYSQAEPHLGFTFVTNIVYFDSGSLLAGRWPGDHFQMDWNLYYDARPGATADSLRLGPSTWAQWRAQGYDKDSLIADPLFVAPNQGDFRLPKASPAFKLGFHPIDLRHVPSF